MSEENEEFEQIKIKPILGALPEYGTEWWTDEQWAEHNAYVEQLKAEGKYLSEGEELTFNFRKKDFEMFDAPPEERFKNFGLVIPNGSTDKPIEIKYINQKPK